MAAEYAFCTKFHPRSSRPRRICINQSLYNTPNCCYISCDEYFSCSCTNRIAFGIVSARIGTTSSGESAGNNPDSCTPLLNHECYVRLFRDTHAPTPSAQEFGQWLRKCSKEARASREKLDAEYAFCTQIHPRSSRPRRICINQSLYNPSSCFHISCDEYISCLRTNRIAFGMN